MTSWVEERETLGILEAAREGGEGVLSEIFRGLAEYEHYAHRVGFDKQGYERWARFHGHDPRDPEVEDLWWSLHTMWLAAWKFFGWDAFRKRLNLALTEVRLDVSHIPETKHG